MKHTVGVGEIRVSTNRGDVLITHALGSCLGIAVHDPVACVGGLLHAMLPSSTIDLQKARKNPSLFIDTGVPKLFHECYRAGAEKRRLRVSVAGGAELNQSRSHAEDIFQIGRRNVAMLKTLFELNGVELHAAEVGGGASRTMSLEIGSGVVSLRINGKLRQI